MLASIFLILFLLLTIIYFSELNPNMNTNQETENATIKKLNDDIRDYIGKKVRITGTITSSEGDYMTVANEGGEFIITNPGSLKRGGRYEIEGVVKSRPAFYYRYYKVDYYIDVESAKEI